MSELARRLAIGTALSLALAMVPSCLLDYDLSGIEVALRPLGASGTAVFEELRIDALDVETESCEGAASVLGAPIGRAYAHHHGTTALPVDWSAPGGASWHVVVPHCTTSLIVRIERLTARGRIEHQGAWQAWAASAPGQLEISVPIEGDRHGMTRLELELEPAVLASALDPSLGAEDLGLDLLVAMESALHAHAIP